MRLTRKAFGILLLGLLTSLLLAGCNLKETMGLGKSVLDVHYEAIRQQDYDAALAQYSDSFFASTDREAWKAELVKVHDQLGDLQSYRIRSFSVNTDMDDTDGTTYEFTCKVTYAEGQEVEVLKLFKPRGSDTISIVGHTFQGDSEDSGDPST